MRIYTFFDRWLKTLLGQSVLMAEKKALETFWARPLGDYLLMLGSISQLPLITQSSYRKKIILVDEKPAQTNIVLPIETIVGQYDKIPIKPNTIDAILIAHTLDISQFNIDHFFKKIQKTLTQKNKLIVIGINPFSFWGIQYVIQKYLFKKHVPWATRMYFPHQIKKHLALINLRVVQHKRLLYRPPVKNCKLFSLLKWIEFLGKNLFFIFNGIYILVAEQKPIALTPLKMNLKKIPDMILKTMPEPATFVSGTKCGHQSNSSK